VSTITTEDGTQIYFKDWGKGKPVLFSHGWPLNADSWEAQMVFLASNGYRCIAHDRRGHGRSSQPWNGAKVSQGMTDVFWFQGMQAGHKNRRADYASAVLDKLINWDFATENLD
jgi:pimeloyl-ACP methyl ester carboxylesterase